MKKTLMIMLLFPMLVWAKDKEMVSVPKDMLTQDQLQKLHGGDLRQNVSAWAGVGKEVGDAVNSSMQAITTQTNNFAQTGVGKLTMAIVVWKIFGDQLIHIFAGLFETLLFVPLWIWSYRKTCMTRSIKIGKDNYKEVLYDPERYDDFTPRMVHGVAVLLFALVTLFTVFSY